jgi:hypothetical protein
MNLTEKDRAFLEKLVRLLEEKDLHVDFSMRPEKRFVLRKNYGEKIHRTFRMTRQGVRWRFDRIFNRIYVSALETILMIERNFGTRLRDDAIKIAQHRYVLRKKRSPSMQRGGKNAAEHEG